ncbi:MAG: YceH family protein [Proteobacteria bacterium]|nr:YceH family protein [Pseudomonadota bacterium]MBU4295312.1 YceH family protein [Pseudomonadota bacterium]MCG2748165.1 YceH family protein [Desulfobulbaceae bacterium]
MEELLDDVEVRVLGCLMEKEMATPEYYPLSLNALVNACNQKSNREPVVNFDEATVIRALDSLKGKRLALQSDASRVTKYEENFVSLNNLLAKEAALICLLLLRGPQTAGELRGRSERLYKFNDIEEVEAKLEDLSEMGFVTRLAKQPGRKECRFMHLLSGEPQAAQSGWQAEPPFTPQDRQDDNGRLEKMEQEITLLQQELQELKEAFLALRKQLE